MSAVTVRFGFVPIRFKGIEWFLNLDLSTKTAFTLQFINGNPSF